MAFSSKGACFVLVLALHLCLLCGPLAAVVFGGLARGLLEVYWRFTKGLLEVY